MARPIVESGTIHGKRLTAARLLRLAEVLAFLLAAGYVLEFAVLALARAAYPFELEWIEGAYVDEARWIARGGFPYPPPGIHFVPTSKTPLYFYLSAGLMKLLGEGFLAPRLLSIAASLGACGLLYAIVRREGGDRLAGLLAAGIYAASFRFAGAWMDLAKTDSLVLFLALAAFRVGQGTERRWRMAASGVLFALAYFAKQIALPVALVLALVSLAASRGRTWLRWAVAAGFGLAAFAALDWASAGWFSFYTFDAVARHDRVADFWLFWKKLLPVLWPALLLALLYAATALRQARLFEWRWPLQACEVLGLGAALLLASWSVFVKTWTYDNGFLPACLGLALLSGMAAAREGGRAEPEGGRVAPGLRIGALALLLIQFGLLFYNPAEQLPTKEDRTEAERFVQQLAGLPGEVLVFNHGYLGALAGKGTYLHSAPLGDVTGAATAPGTDAHRRREETLQAFNQAIEEGRFDWIIVDRPNSSWLPHYLYARPVFPDSPGFYPVTGAVTRPESLMLRNPIPHGGELPLDQPLYDPLFLEGWGEAGGGERWMEAGRAGVRLALEKGGYWLRIEVLPACRQGRPAARTLVAGWNGRELGRAELAACQPTRLSFYIDRDQVAEGLNELWFELPGAGEGAALAFTRLALEAE